MSGSSGRSGYAHAELKRGTSPHFLQSGRYFGQLLASKSSGTTALVVRDGGFGRLGRLGSSSGTIGFVVRDN